MRSRLRLLLNASAIACFTATWLTLLTPIPSRGGVPEFKRLPSVAEADLPQLSNSAAPFRGKLERDDFTGATWVAFPHVENPGSFGFDPQGRLYVAETHRFWQGVPDMRGLPSGMVQADFQAVTLEDRRKLYRNWPGELPEDWLTGNADRVIRFEDADRNGFPDRRTVFADGFDDVLDGLGFSILADDGENVYFTCIPNLWRLRDTDGDGVADQRDVLATGFGVRVSFIGHDLHGITRGPDGLLYFSVGDRGYHVQTREGKTFSGSGMGAIFRCEPDGSGLELYCTGLRNPQELAFDDHGNLFTFDNTGDIGDRARLVYALDGTDSGWRMAHQAPHQYRDDLDWGEFRPDRSLWVAEGMFQTAGKNQVGWVYPPVAHVGNGPSGVTWLTGESVPPGLRDRFLLADYRGAFVNSRATLIGVESQGAGFRLGEVEDLASGVGVSDVELGFDGRIYLCDWGGGWRVNRNGSIQVLTWENEDGKQAGAEVAGLFAGGFERFSVEVLAELLNHLDRRVRQQAQFELVRRGDDGRRVLSERLRDEQAGDLARLHALWGLGQILRTGEDVAGIILPYLEKGPAPVRENAVRMAGDLGLTDAKTRLLRLLESPSDRIRCLAAVALGRICEPGDAEAVEALYELANRNEYGNKDVFVRHGVISALKRIGTEEAALGATGTKTWAYEEKLAAVTFLRSRGSDALLEFLDDPKPAIRHEAIRAIYETNAVDSEAGEALAALAPRIQSFPETLQFRILAANFRRGQLAGAQRLLQIAANAEAPMSTRRMALIALSRWTKPPVTDPVLGSYRPVPESDARDFGRLREAIGKPLRAFLGGGHPAELTARALRFAESHGLDLDDALLAELMANADLGAEVRVATMDSMIERLREKQLALVAGLLEDPEPAVRAAALSHAFELGMERVAIAASAAVSSADWVVARAAIDGLGHHDATPLVNL